MKDNRLIGKPKQKKEKQSRVYREKIQQVQIDQLEIGDDNNDNVYNQIHQEELTLNQLINKYDGIQKDYEEFLSQNDNGKIKELLDEGQYFEEKIPQLKEMMLKLEDKINGFIDDSQRLNNQLVDYQNVIMQIEELLNENYD